MALPEDSEARQECYKNVLRDWRYDGYIQFKDIVVEEQLPQVLPEYLLRGIASRLHDHVIKEGGRIHEVRETRPEWDDQEFHFDLRVPIEGRWIYFETLLLEDRMGFFIHVVSVKYA